MKQDLTNKNYWDQLNLGSNRPPLFFDVIDKYLKPNPNTSVLEVGCAGGNYLAEMYRRYQFQTFGVDYSDQIQLTTNLFSNLNFPPPQLFKEDFFVWKPPALFDVVCSFGFLEHFSTPETVFARHAEFLAPKGILIISIPHFRKIQWILRSLLEPKILSTHHTKAMDLQILNAYCIQNHLIPLHINYYQCFEFWYSTPPHSLWQRFGNHIVNFLKPIIKKTLRYQPNTYTSPHILLIAQKK